MKDFTIIAKEEVGKIWNEKTKKTSDSSIIKCSHEFRGVWKKDYSDVETLFSVMKDYMDTLLKELKKTWKGGKEQ